jgi:hypothetical protein
MFSGVLSELPTLNSLKVVKYLITITNIKLFENFQVPFRIANMKLFESFQGLFRIANMKYVENFQLSHQKCQNDIL